MDNNQVLERIKYLIKELNYKQADFARRIDVDTSNLSKYLNGKLPLSESLINRIVVNLGVSKQWLEEGTDLPFAKNVVPAVLQLPVSKLSNPTDESHGTPVYDIDVTAGSLPRTRMFAEDQIIGFIDLPEVGGTGQRIAKVNGDSMAPVIQNGDYVSLRELSSLQYIYWGHIYVVILDDYRMLKYVRKNDNPALVTLRSANANYDDMEILRADIRELMIVQQIIHIDTRM